MMMYNHQSMNFSKKKQIFKLKYSYSKSVQLRAAKVDTDRATYQRQTIRMVHSAPLQ